MSKKNKQALLLVISLRAASLLIVMLLATRKPSWVSWRWQTRATRKHAENCSDLTRKQVAECRQVMDLFEVMQQLSAPSGEWYWRILLENSVLFPPRTCLTPRSEWTPCDINVTHTSLKSAFNGLQFHHWQYGSIFIPLAVIASETREMSRNSIRIRPYSSSTSSKVIDLGVKCQWKADTWLPIVVKLPLHYKTALYFNALVYMSIFVYYWCVIFCCIAINKIIEKKLQFITLLTAIMLCFTHRKQQK